MSINIQHCFILLPSSGFSTALSRTTAILDKCGLEQSLATGGSGGTSTNMQTPFMKLQNPRDHWPHHHFPKIT